MSVWLVDRSRMETGTDHCQMARYWKYHYLGWGIDLAKPALDPWIGIAVHDVLAFALGGGGIAEIVLLTWVKRLSTICEKRGDSTHTALEAAHLMAALSYGWWTMWQEWLSGFEIEAIEREFTLDLDDGRIRLMAKPDLVLRAKDTKKLSILDWKTMASFDEETTPAQYRDSVQLALLTAVVEQALGEPVETFWIAGMVKGSKRHFEKDGQKTPERRFYSHLCYASPPQEPFRKDWEIKGYWYNKAPVWESMSAIDWIDWLRAKHPEVPRETFPLMGPFQRQTHMIPQALRGVVGSENRWIEGLWRLSEAKSEEFHSVLDSTFSRAYGNCTSYYGEECPYYRLCFGLQGSDNPIGSGLYKIRRPHHQPELDAMKEAGEPIPPEAYDEPVAAEPQTS